MKRRKVLYSKIVARKMFNYNKFNHTVSIQCLLLRNYTSHISNWLEKESELKTLYFHIICHIKTLFEKKEKLAKSLLSAEFLRASTSGDPFSLL